MHAVILFHRAPNPQLKVAGVKVSERGEASTIVEIGGKKGGWGSVVRAGCEASLASECA